MSCTTKTRLWDASATARWNSRDARVKPPTSLISALGLRNELAQPGVILGGGIDGGELGGAAFEGALRIHDLAD